MAGWPPDWTTPPAGFSGAVDVSTLAGGRGGEERGVGDGVPRGPARAGSSREFLEALGALGPKRIVYVSCNPETLERDVTALEKEGYRAEEVWPVDMFPWTAGVEEVCLLS